MLKRDERPNFLFIMSDQHRHDFLGIAGKKYVQTPNIDKIAQSGMVFENCFTPSPLCTPARIALATGLYASRVGGLDNDLYLPSNITTYYQRLRDSGYHVGLSGKLDLAKPDTYNSLNGDRPVTYAHGFTKPCEIEGKMHSTFEPFPIGPYSDYMFKQGKLQRIYEDGLNESFVEANRIFPFEPVDFLDTFIGQKAIEIINDFTIEYPWHMFVSFSGPHDPFDPPEKYYNMFKDLDVDFPIDEKYLEGKPEWVKKKNKHMTEDQKKDAIRLYCAYIKLIDDQIGEILAAVEERGEMDSTYIIYTSDHGEMLGDFGLYTKQTPYESSIRIPLIVAGPGISPGQRSDVLVELEDLNPTICEIASLPPQQNIDGFSFKNVLFDHASTHRDSIYTEMLNWRAIRTHEYKLVENYNTDNEVYDMINDPTDLHNIINDDFTAGPEVAQQFFELMQKTLQHGRCNPRC